MYMAYKKKLTITISVLHWTPRMNGGGDKNKNCIMIIMYFE